MIVYRNHQNYPTDRLKVNHVETRKNPEKYGYTEDSVKIQTIPGQSQSVKEILERNKKGRPIIQE